MVASNALLHAPPVLVEEALKRLGSHLRVARVRRRLTIRDAATRIGAGPRAVMDAEKGKPSTSVAVYAALLWAYDLLAPFGDLAHPNTDEQGLALLSHLERTRVRPRRELSGDF